MSAASIDIRLVASTEEREWCAQLMATSEPWVTLRRDLDSCRHLFRDASRETYLAEVDQAPVGFLILTLAGPFSGYIQSICVAPNCRGAGIGSALLHFGEQRIFRESPNVFLCVSSFNPRARRLYERSGYQFVGELSDYLVAGHAELLFRKSRGPWRDFVPTILPSP